MCSEWLNILITSYSKEVINTGTFKHVFLRKSKFFKKGYIIHSSVVRSSHRKVQNKHIDIYFFPHPSTTEALWQQGHTKTKLKFVLFCHKVFEKRGYVWVNKREKLCDCHKLSIGWFLWGLVILIFTKIGGYFFFGLSSVYFSCIKNLCTFNLKIFQ